MLSFTSPPHLHHSLHLPPPLFFTKPTCPSTTQPHHHHHRHLIRLRRHSTIPNSINPFQQQPPRTLFPGGYKRPEIKVPNIILQLTSQEVLNDESVVGFVDKAVSEHVGIVVVNGEGGSGGKLYEAARFLNSVIKDRAFLMIDERVDIAAAVNASGVLLSDQGLPTIVARNTMSDSRSESVVLPIIARYVETSNAALEAADAEGADFLILRLNGDVLPEDLIRMSLNHIKIPIFLSVDTFGDGNHFDAAVDLLKLGVSGLVLSLKDLKLFSEEKMKKLLYSVNVENMKKEEPTQISETFKMSSVMNGSVRDNTVAGFVKLEKREQELIETERSRLLGVIDVIRRAAPLMEEVALLTDAVSQLDDPFLLVIVGEFNSGKSTVINALLGKRFVKDGVVPTTNEITFLRYSKVDSYDPQHCERHPDGQYSCYLPAPILKEMIIVDTPGTNVILQRQQRLTEEFVPRADLILFVVSADRPLTESEVNFLRYIQQWKKRVIFVLNKSDLYRSSDELEEAIIFIKNNVKKLLNIEDVLLFPVSARSALEKKLLASSGVLGDSDRQPASSQWSANSFNKLENYLYSFLDGSTTTGIERMKLKLFTPVGIAEQLISSCQKTKREECQQSKEDVVLVNDIINSVEEYAKTIDRDSISWKRRSLSLIDNVQSRVLKIAESTLQLSNLDLVSKYIFKGEKSTPMPVTASIQNDIIDPAVSEAEKLITEYTRWLQSTNAEKGSFYRESLEKRWPSFVDHLNQNELATSGFLLRKHETSIKVIRNFNAAAVAKQFEKEIRETFLVTFGGLAAAGLSASLLTSVLPTTLEDLLALGLCSAGGLVAISNFPARRQRAIDKVKKTAGVLAHELEEAMQNDLLESASSLENYVKLIGKPYQEAAQDRLDKVLGTLNELSVAEKDLKTLQTEIQNLHISQ